MIPMIVRLRIQENGGRNFRLWIPLFLIWPFCLLGLPFLLIGLAIVYLFTKKRQLIYCVPAVFSLICAIRGLEIDVKSHDSKIFISIN